MNRSIVLLVLFLFSVAAQAGDVHRRFFGQREYIYSLAADRPAALAIADAGACHIATDTGDTSEWSGASWIEGFTCGRSSSNTELPAAVDLETAIDSPVGPYVGSLLYSYDGTDWDQIQQDVQDLDSGAGSDNVAGGFVATPASGGEQVVPSGQTSELNSNTVGGVEIDCDPTFGQIGVSGCSYSLKVDTTRSDGISCRTPGVVARRFEVHNSGRNTSGNNDGLAGYDHATTSSDCFGFDGQYFWVENHGGDPENVGSAAVDWQISELPPVGLEYAYLRSGLITGSVRCLKDLSLDTLRTSGLILQACAPAYYLNFDGRIEYWNNTEYGSQIDFGQTSDGQTAPGTRTATRKNSLFCARDAWLNAPTFSPTPVRVRSGTSPTFNYTLDYNVYRTGTGLGRKDGTPCQAKLGSENACTLATWKTLNIGFGSPWDTNSQEVASDPFVGPLPDVNQENTGTDLVDPTDANTGFRLSVGHATRTAGTAPPSWVRDFCGNTYVDAGGGQYAVGAFEPSNADCPPPAST